MIGYRYRRVYRSDMYRSDTSDGHSERVLVGYILYTVTVISSIKSDFYENLTKIVILSY